MNLWERNIRVWEGLTGHQALKGWKLGKNGAIQADKLWLLQNLAEGKISPVCMSWHFS